MEVVEAVRKHPQPMGPAQDEPVRCAPERQARLGIDSQAIHLRAKSHRNWPYYINGKEGLSRNPSRTSDISDGSAGAPARGNQSPRCRSGSHQRGFGMLMSACLTNRVKGRYTNQLTGASHLAARLFCEWVSERSGRIPVYSPATPPLDYRFSSEYTSSIP